MKANMQETSQDSQNPSINNNFSNDSSSKHIPSSPFSHEIINNYLIKETIGSGTFAKVKLAQHIPTNAIYAIKILIKANIPDRDLKFIFRELNLLKEFSHHNIIKLIETFETPEKYYIVTEFCENGDVYKIIVNNIRLSNDVAALFYYQLICGLEYIHNKKIIHRDIKPENLLITQNKYLKIIDFGLSNYLPEEGLLATPCGSPCYASPEMVSGRKYGGIKHDIWSTGVVLYAMLCGYLPFEEENNELLFKKIMECDLEYPEFLNDDAKSLIQKILTDDYEERLSIAQIKEEPFFLHGKLLYESIEKEEIANTSNTNNTLKTEINDKEEVNMLTEEIQNDKSEMKSQSKVLISIDNTNSNLNSSITNNTINTNNIKSKTSKKRTTPAKSNYQTTDFLDKHTNSSKKSSNNELSRRNNTSYKKQYYIYTEEAINRYIPHPSLRKNYKHIISNNIPKKTEVSTNRSNVPKKSKKHNHYLTGYSTNQKVILQYQQKPKTASFVKILTQNQASSSKSRNNSSTKVKPKSIFEQLYIKKKSHTKNPDEINRTSHIHKRPKHQFKITAPKTEPSPLTAGGPLISGIPLQIRPITHNNSKGDSIGNSNKGRASSPNLKNVKTNSNNINVEPKRNTDYKTKPKEYYQKFLTNNSALPYKLNLNINRISLSKSPVKKPKASNNNNCYLKKGKKRSNHRLEFASIRSNTENNECSLGKQQFNNVKVQENCSVPYQSKMHLNYRSNTIYSKRGNLSSSINFHSSNNRNLRNINTINTAVSISKRPAKMRTLEQISLGSNLKKGMKNGFGYKNMSLRTYSKESNI